MQTRSKSILVPEGLRAAQAPYQFLERGEGRYFGGFTALGVCSWRTITQDPECPNDACGIRANEAEWKQWIPCASHPQSCGIYIRVIGRSLGMGVNEINDLVQCAPLHDIGKLVIPEKILNAPRALTPEERRIVNKHTTMGANLIRKARKTDVAARSPWEIAIAMVEHHHERWDGRGYPKGLKGKQIPKCARMLALADTYDAIRSERPYKKGKPHEEAIEIIKEEAGCHLDPEMVEIFLDNETEFGEISQGRKDCR